MPDDEYVQQVGNIIVRGDNFKELITKLAMLRESIFATPENLLFWYAYEHRRITLKTMRFILVAEPKFSPEVDAAINKYFELFDESAIDLHLKTVRFQQLIRVNFEHAASFRCKQTPEEMKKIIQGLIDKWPN